MLKCKRNGCRKNYDPADNPQDCCRYHPGKPIFHDTKKGWTCCNKIVFDWDQFQKIPTCAVANHNNQETVMVGQDGFFKSDTVKNADSALSKEGGIKIKSIEEENKKFQQEKKKKQLEKGPLKVFLNAEGQMRCINKGCNKFYTEEVNGPQVCAHHSGAPVFHDVRKFWTCCKKQVWDWDEFVKIPTCTVGKHSPKMV